MVLKVNMFIIFDVLTQRRFSLLVKLMSNDLIVVRQNGDLL